MQKSSAGNFSHPPHMTAHIQWDLNGVTRTTLNPQMLLLYKAGTCMSIEQLIFLIKLKTTLFDIRQSVIMLICLRKKSQTLPSTADQSILVSFASNALNYNTEIVTVRGEFHLSNDKAVTNLNNANVLTYSLKHGSLYHNLQPPLPCCGLFSDKFLLNSHTKWHDLSASTAEFKYRLTESSVHESQEERTRSISNIKPLGMICVP